jgi:hypothetical protein
MTIILLYKLNNQLRYRRLRTYVRNVYGSIKTAGICIHSIHSSIEYMPNVQNVCKIMYRMYDKFFSRFYTL